MMFPVDRPPMESAALPDGYRPTPNDCLLGRGKKNWNHKGNALFRSLVRENVKAYQEAPDKQAKNAVVYAIVSEIRRRGGRFLKQDNNKRWFEIGDHLAREKVGHSLRDHVNAQTKAAAALHREQSQEKFELGTSEGETSECSEAASTRSGKRESAFCHELSELFSSPKQAKRGQANAALQRSISLPTQSGVAPFSTLPAHQQSVPVFTAAQHLNLELPNTSTRTATDAAAHQAFSGGVYQPAQTNQGNPESLNSNPYLPPLQTIGSAPHPSSAPQGLVPAQSSLTTSNWSLESNRTPEQGRAFYPNFLLPLDASMEPTPLAEPFPASVVPDQATSVGEGTQHSSKNENNKEGRKHPSAGASLPFGPPFSS